MSRLALDIFKAEDCRCVKNAYVYGLRNSIRGAKFPMSYNVDTLDGRLTRGIAGLARSGTGEGHDQWLTGVIVQMDLTFTNKVWVEAERYHFFDFVSSCSTMHKIIKFALDISYNEYVDPRIIEIMKEKQAEYNKLAEDPSYKSSKTLDQLYLEMLYSNPAGFKLTARMSTNYRQLKTIYKQRKNHRLKEWREFCEWIEGLPYSGLITGEEVIDG